MHGAFTLRCFGDLKEHVYPAVNSSFVIWVGEESCQGHPSHSAPLLDCGRYFPLYGRDECGLFGGFIEAGLLSAAILHEGMLHGRSKLSVSLLLFKTAFNPFRLAALVSLVGDTCQIDHALACPMVMLTLGMLGL